MLLFEVLVVSKRLSSNSSFEVRHRGSIDWSSVILICNYEL